MAAPTPNAVLQLGIITIPLKINPAARNETTDLKNLHRECAERGAEASLGQLKRCKGCLKEVSEDQIVKGYAKGDGTFLLFTPEEIKSLQAEKSKGMTVQAFVPFEQVDPVWLGASNLLSPVDKTTVRIFMLLYQLMKQSNLAAVVTYYGHGRDKCGVIRATSETLMLHDCFYPTEIRAYSDKAKVELPLDMTFKPNELALAGQLINDLKSDFTPELFGTDSFLNRVEELKKAREAGLPMPEGLPVTPEVNSATEDLAALLTQGLAAVRSLRPGRKIDAQTPDESKPPGKIEPVTKSKKEKKRA